MTTDSATAHAPASTKSNGGDSMRNLDGKVAVSAASSFHANVNFAANTSPAT
jgi:hypothetical protein